MDSITVSRLLEQTFRDSLAAKSSLSGISVRTLHEDAAIDLPCVVVAAKSLGKELGIRIDGQEADECELSIECRAHAGDAGAPAAVETIAEIVRTHIEQPLQHPAWRLIVLDFRSTERGFDGQTRTVTLQWQAIALPA